MPFFSIFVENLDEMEENKKGLRFGIITDDIKMQLWKVNVVKTLVANGMVLSTIIKIQGQNESIGNKAAKWFNKLSRKMFFNTESYKNTNLNDFVDISGIPIKNCMTKVIGDTMFFADNDIQFIENQGLDFIIRLNNLRVGGELVDNIRYGIWEFCFHDEKTYIEAKPNGFWEFLGKKSSNAVSLQRTTNDREKAVILKKNHYPIIKSSYTKHIEQMLTDCCNMPLQVCRSIVNDENAGKGYETRLGKETKSGMGFGGFMKYLCVATWRKIAGTGRDDNSFDRDIGIAEVPVFDFFQDPDSHRKKIKWLRRASRSQRYSTPSAITTANDTYVFFVVDDTEEKTSTINMVRKSEGYKDLHTVLDNGHALSYPFVFRKDEAIFCIPQDIESQQITLYRFNEESLQLEKDTILYDGIKAYRPTAVFGNNHWNIFYSKEESLYTKLYLMSSDDLRGSYTQFYNNPVKTDNRGALMAGGFISINGKTYRPAYNQSQRHVVLYEVDEMSDGIYTEHQAEKHVVGKLKWSRFGNGTQCVSGNDIITVIDGMR